MDILGQVRTDGPVTAKSFKPTGMTTAQRTALPNVAGEVVYDSTTNTLWRNTGTAWVELAELTPAALTYNATQTWDLRANPRATLVLTGNATLQTPTNGVVGQTYSLLVRASGASRTLSFASTYVKAFDNTAFTLAAIPDTEFRALLFMWDSGRMRAIGA